MEAGGWFEASPAGTSRARQARKEVLVPSQPYWKAAS
jgi:hypothetical protein